MIDAKQAVKQRATDWLGTGISNLEEVELDKYKNREVWSITLSVPRDLTVLSRTSTDWSRSAPIQAVSDRCANRRVGSNEIT
jgi:hypothetical protein